MSDRVLGILLDSFWEILLPGLTATVPLTVVSFSIGLIGHAARDLAHVRGPAALP